MKFNWVQTVERVGIASAVCGALLWGMFRFAGWWIAEQREYHEAQTTLTNKLVDAQIDQGKQTTVTLGEMNVAVKGVQAMSRRQIDNDKELLTIQREIRDSIRSQSFRPEPRAPAPKAGGGTSNNKPVNKAT